jgi:hypothetical protein
VSNRYVLGTLLAFGAINAFAGWYGLSGASGALEWLIPSLILLVVVGGALVLAAIDGHL